LWAYALAVRLQSSQIWKLWFLAALVHAPVLACGSSQPRVVEYPKAPLRARTVTVKVQRQLDDALPASFALTRPVRGDGHTYPLQIPEAFTELAQQRLAPHLSGDGAEITAHVKVERADLTFLEDSRGERLELSVLLALELEDNAGRPVTRGKGFARLNWPGDHNSTEATEANLLSTAAEAVERFFASESTARALTTAEAP
jgi:hypothetical protein